MLYGCIYPHPKGVLILNISSRQGRRQRGRVTQAQILILKVWFFLYNPVNTSHEIFYLAETWGGGHEISNATGCNLGYWFLGTSLSVNPNYNRLLCAHHLLANGVGLLVDMTNYCTISIDSSVTGHRAA
jgi:hypothetical protein